MISIKACMMCKSVRVKLIYLESARYRIECMDCGQYLEFNAPSEMAARVMWNQTFRNDFDMDKVLEQLEERSYSVQNNASHFKTVVNLKDAITIVKGAVSKDE